MACEWDQGFEPAEPVAAPEPVAAVAVAAPASGSNCQAPNSRDTVGKAVGRFRDMFGLRCNQGATNLAVGAAAMTVLIANAI